MIKVDKTEVRIEGKKSTILTEYALVTKSLKEVLSRTDGKMLAAILIFASMKTGLEVELEEKPKEEKEDDDDDILKVVDRLIESLKEEKDGRN